MERLRADLVSAMRRRDGEEISALRSALAAIANAEAQPVEAESNRLLGDGPIAGAAVGVGAAEVPRRLRTDDDARRIVMAERDERREAAAQIDESGGNGSKLWSQAEFLDRYLR